MQKLTSVLEFYYDGSRVFGPLATSRIGHDMFD